ncbi:MAG: diphthamide biosynthesis enzyme Dph2 [Thermoplasmata archaeon]
MMLQDYEIDWDNINEKLSKMNAKRILIELPEGLKIYIFEIMKKLINFEIYFSGENIYGACDVSDLSSKFDAVLHFGHAEIPNINYGGKVIFVEMRNKININENLINKIVQLNCKKIGLLATIQYIDFLSKIPEILSKNNIEIFIGHGDSRLKYPGQVLGCDFSSALKIMKEVECFLVIADGEFHAIGIAISTGMKTFALNPITEELKEININEFLKKRYMIIEKASKSKSVGIIVSSKIGQSRYEIAKSLMKKIEESGRKAAIIVMNEITPYKIKNLPFDVFVNTACPRISTDDAENYEYKMLTPMEMEMAIGVRQMYPYVMDMISQISPLR